MVNDFSVYLKLERSMSENTISAYCSDVMLLEGYMVSDQNSSGVAVLEKATPEILEAFLSRLHSKNLSKRSQARIISSLRSFFQYLEMEGKPCGIAGYSKIKALPSCGLVSGGGRKDNIQR